MEKLLAITNEDETRARTSFLSAVPFVPGKEARLNLMIAYAEGVIDEQEEIGNSLFARKARYIGKNFFSSNLAAFYNGIAWTLDLISPELTREPLKGEELRAISGYFKDHIIKPDGEIVGVNMEPYLDTLDTTFNEWRREVVTNNFVNEEDRKAFKVGSDITSMGYANRQRLQAHERSNLTIPFELGEDASLS